MSIIYKFPENIPYDHGEDDLYRFGVNNIYSQNSGTNPYIIENDEENCLITIGDISKTNRDLTRGQDFWFWFRYDNPISIPNLGKYLETNKDYLLFNVGEFCLYCFTPNNSDIYMRTNNAKDKKLEDRHIGLCFTDMIHQPFFAHCYDTLVCYTNSSNKKNDIMKVYYIPEVAEKSRWGITGGFSEFKGSKLDQYVIPGTSHLERRVCNNENPINNPYKSFRFK